jgi:hypothetical protein
MSGKSITARYYFSEIRAMRERGDDHTRPDAPKAQSLGAAFWKSARVVNANRQDLDPPAPR